MEKLERSSASLLVMKKLTWWSWVLAVWVQFAVHFWEVWVTTAYIMLTYLLLWSLLNTRTILKLMPSIINLQYQNNFILKIVDTLHVSVQTQTFQLLVVKLLFLWAINEIHLLRTVYIIFEIRQQKIFHSIQPFEFTSLGHRICKSPPWLHDRTKLVLPQI